MFSDEDVKAAMDHGAKAGGAFGTALLPGISAVMRYTADLLAARGGYAEDIVTLKARVAVLEAEVQNSGPLALEVLALRSELTEARATIARLTAAAQALSEHADKTGGPIPDPCICGGEEHHTFHCPARIPPRTEDCSGESDCGCFDCAAPYGEPT